MYANTYWTAFKKKCHHWSNSQNGHFHSLEEDQVEQGWNGGLLSCYPFCVLVLASLSSYLSIYPPFVYEKYKKSMLHLHQIKVCQKRHEKEYQQSDNKHTLTCKDIQNYQPLELHPFHCSCPYHKAYAMCWGPFLRTRK